MLSGRIWPSLTVEWKSEFSGFSIKLIALTAEIFRIFPAKIDLISRSAAEFIQIGCIVTDNLLAIHFQWR